MSSPTSLVSIVAPVYNNGPTLEPLADRVKAAMGGRAYELIFVNDGSRDDSPQILRRLAAERREVVVISFTRNFGQHPAIGAGFESARGEYVVLMDADLQDRPEDIPVLLGELGDGVEVVYTTKREAEDYSSRLTSRLYHYIFSRIVGQPVPTNIGTFRAFTRRVNEALLSYPERGILYGPLMVYMGFRAKFVEVSHGPRQHGQSAYTLRSRLMLAVNSLISYTDLPHRVLVGVGLTLITGSLLYGGLVLIQYAIGGAALPAGMTLVVLILVLMFGTLTLSLGIIGSYVFRVYQEVLRRPRYLIAETLNLKTSRGIAAYDVENR